MKRIDLTPYRERFTDDCQEIISFAFETARELMHPFLEPLHLLYAYARVSSDMMETTLAGIGIGFDAWLHELENWLSATSGGDGNVAPSETTRRAFHLALENSQRANRGQIASVDLLLGLLRSEDITVIRLLEKMNLSVLLAVQGFQRYFRESEKRQREKRQQYELPAYLKQFATNLNYLANQGDLAPLVGREEELRQMAEVLCHRRRSNSVMLVGEAGVGKTALAEGFAMLLESASDLIPPYLADRQLIQLHLNSLVAGTMFRGMFEDRIEKILKEIREHPEYLLFIDEAHTLVGAGSAIGVPTDAANIFKGALARGEIQMIGATTQTEYRRFIMEDEALARRFRTVTVSEPDPADTRIILAGVTGHLEALYDVELSEEVLDLTLRLSIRYKRSLRRPDKVIGWLDTACVRTEIAGESQVTCDHILDVVSDDAGIPRAFVERQAEDRLRTLSERLANRVVGQEDALQRVAERLRTNKGPLKENFDRPDGAFLFLGPTGVGKTEVARSLAFDLFGDANKMVRIDMSEYQTGGLGIDKLIGMPRGIVGSEMGGLLTSKISDEPYAVVLLDEIEKADRNVLNLFLQIFDEGWCTDGRGRKVYFSDTIIIMTSNLGTRALRSLSSPLGFAQQTDGNDRTTVRREVMREVENELSPELLNRLDEIIVFEPLTLVQVHEIARRYVDNIGLRLADEGKQLLVTPEALEELARGGYNQRYGARQLKRHIDKTIKFELTRLWHDSETFLVDLVEGKPVVLAESRLLPA